MLNHFLRSKKALNEEGFTLIELMIVVVVIGILAAVAIPVYANQQTAAINAVSKDHIRQVRDAVEVARAKTGKTLLEITGTNCTYCGFPLDSTVDPLDLPKTHQGWVRYNNSLKRISEISGVDITHLLDGYGRPIMIDENEGENGNCGKDYIASYKNDYAYGSRENQVNLPNVSSYCLNR